MKWLVYFFAGLLLLPVNLNGQESISIFDIDSTNFPIMKAKFLAFNNKQIPETPNIIDIVLTENGITRKVTDIYCPPSPPPIPLSSVLTIDVSGSMTEKYNDVPRMVLAQTAAKAWVNNLDMSQNE
ncbi:MAG: hypothetical protein HYZ54_01070, partial [Ignavibacteriae bacterium]|nr:hypothetical protein [Ignavibacteriota bacterium]